MARKKSLDKGTTFSVRCSDKTLSSLQDLARLSRRTVSEMVGEMCAELVAANKQRIASFRRQAATPIKLPTFNSSQKNNTPTVDDVGADENEN